MALLIGHLFVAALFLPSGVHKLLTFSAYAASLKAKGLPFAALWAVVLVAAEALARSWADQLGIVIIRQAWMRSSMRRDGLRRGLVGDADLDPDVDREQCHRQPDERGPDEEPGEAGPLDGEAREAGQDASRKGAERGQEPELARRMIGQPGCSPG